MIIFRMLNGGLLGRIDGCLRYVSGAGHLFIVESNVRDQSSILLLIIVW